MDVDTVCPMCERLDADGGHLFLHCKHVQILWRRLNLEDARMQLEKCKNAKDMLMSIFGMEQGKRLLIISLLWQWWIARNKKNAKDGPRN
jgi:hypothetical protein